MHLQVCGEEKKGRNTCARTSLTGQDMVKGAKHDMRVNDSPKSGPDSCRHMTSFCSLFLLHVQYIFNMESELVMRRLTLGSFLYKYVWPPRKS
jgi:hypothetical protein